MDFVNSVLTFLRGSVRPILTFTIIGLIASLILKLTPQFADVEMTKAAFFFVLGSGTTIMAYWFGERKAK